MKFSFATDFPIIYQWFVYPNFFVILLIISQSFIKSLPILISCLLIIFQSFINLLPIDYQWFTYGIFMLLLLPIVHQSLPMSLIFLLQLPYCCCRKQWLPINCQYSITNHSIGNFLPIGSQCFTNHQFTSSIGKFTNSCQWVPIGNDIWGMTGFL